VGQFGGFRGSRTDLVELNSQRCRPDPGPTGCATTAATWTLAARPTPPKSRSTSTCCRSGRPRRLRWRFSSAPARITHPGGSVG